jgi:hypothetical protein
MEFKYEDEVRDSFNVNQLRQLASYLTIEIYVKYKKDELITEIQRIIEVWERNDDERKINKLNKFIKEMLDDDRKIKKIKKKQKEKRNFVRREKKKAAISDEEEEEEEEDEDEEDEEKRRNSEKKKKSGKTRINEPRNKPIFS